MLSPLQQKTEALAAETRMARLASLRVPQPYRLKNVGLARIRFASEDSPSSRPGCRQRPCSTERYMAEQEQPNDRSSRPGLTMALESLRGRRGRRPKFSVAYVAVAPAANALPGDFRGGDSYVSTWQQKC